MLRLKAGTATLLIGPRAAAGVLGSRYCLDSEAEIRQRLMAALQDPASREALRRFWAHWQGDARVSGIKDHSIIERIARMGVGGPLIVFLVTDLSLHRHDTSAARSKQATEALQTRSRAMPWQGPVRAPAPVKVSMVKPSATKPPAMVDRSIVSGPKRLVGDWSIAEKLTAIVVLTADSRKLSDDVRQQLKQILSDPAFVAWLVGSLMVWFASQFFIVGEILDMLLVGAALVFTGTGIFAMQALIGAAHLIGQFVVVTRAAKDEKDLEASADILADIIVMIGITVLIAALTHATTRATSSGLEAKGSVRKPPPAREAAVDVSRRRGGGEKDGVGRSQRSNPDNDGTTRSVEHTSGGSEAAKDSPTRPDSPYSPEAVNRRSAEFYELYGDDPARGTLNNVEARKWYLDQDAKIAENVDRTLSIEQQAKQAFDQRNANRARARELMSDRVTADRLAREEPNRTWEQMVKSREQSGLSGDDIYRSIINSSQKTRTSVNKQLGLDDE